MAEVSQEDRFLQDCKERGIRVLEKGWVDDVLRAAPTTLGAGAFGSCVKVSDLHSETKLVIKTFSRRPLEHLAAEALKLQRVQLPGVQRLVGVCADSHQLVTQYAGKTLMEHFRTPTSLVNFKKDFVSVFL